MGLLRSKVYNNRKPLGLGIQFELINFKKSIGTRDFNWTAEFYGAYFGACLKKLKERGSIIYRLKGSQNIISLFFSKLSNFY